MKVWLEALNQLLAGWGGYYGLFIAALLAGSIIPLGSEALFALLPYLGEAIAISLGIMRAAKAPRLSR